MGVYQSFRSTAAPMAKAILFKSGFYRALRRARPSRKLGILRYHAVCGPEGHGYADPSICVSPAEFVRHAEYLAGNYRVVRLPDAIDALAQGLPLPDNALAITFDDGYADNLGAARVLHRLGLTATFYITAGCMSGGQPFWPAEIRTLAALMSRGRFTLTVDGRDVEVASGSRVERREAVRFLTKLFKSRTIPEREAFREQLRAQAGNPVTPCPMLSWKDLGKMQAMGMTVGAHTMTHPNLPSAGLADARAEMAGSRRRLEAELGTTVTMFSYPNGGAERYYTPEIRQLAIEVGFRGVTTSRNGFAGPGSDLYALERIQVSERVEDLIFALEVERFAFAPVN